MYWKMNTRLTHPLVTSMGHHDPLDGMITYMELEASIRHFPEANFPDLKQEIAEMEEISAGRDWTTLDPLGLGGLLFDLYRLAQLRTNGDKKHDALIAGLISDAQEGLRDYSLTNALDYPAGYRLAFRELGLAIGLKALPQMKVLIRESSGVEKLEDDLFRMIDALESYLFLAGKIENFWCEPESQAAPSWQSHRNINMVMLATCIEPDGFLRI
jgi:hypothetical protein